MSKYALMLFDTEMNLGISDKPNQWICTRIYYTNDGTTALNMYSDIPNPASQLLKGESDEDLQDQIRKMKDNYKDEEWLNAYLYPYL